MLNGQQKANPLSECCEKYLMLHSFFNRFYRMDTEQQQIMNQMFLNEKIAQRVLCEQYNKLGERQVMFGLLYPT